MPKKRHSKNILITAGPTIEPLDPVRFLSNHSTGEMGFELARAAKRKNHHVILISGPTRLTSPRGIRFVRVNRALEMQRAVFRFFGRADCVIMAAAVADFRPASVSNTKIKKKGGSLSVRLKRNPDILSALGEKKGKRVLIGFSLDTKGLLDSAKNKLKSKNLDIIVANKAGNDLDPFGSGSKDVFIIHKNGRVKAIKKASKRKIAGVILRLAEREFS